MKSDRATTYQRIQEIYKMMCEGSNSINIIEHARNAWNLSNKRTYQMISIALSWLKKTTEKNIDELRLEANLRFDKLYSNLYKLGEYSEAGKIQSMKNKINGLEIKDINLRHSGEVKTKSIIEILAESIKDEV